MGKYYSYNDDDFMFNHSHDANPDPALFKMHTHDYAELYCFISGKGNFHIEGSEYPMQSGDILIMRRAEAHYIEISPDVPYERTALHFRESVLSGIDRDGVLLHPFYDRSPGKLNLYRKADFPDEYHDIIIRKMLENTPEKRLHIIGSLIPLLLELKNVFELRKQNDTASEDTIVFQIINDINLHLFNPLSLNSICEKFYISKPQLCRVFKKATGSTVWDYITVKRLLCAREMLKSGQTPTRVCSACGFNDYSVFYRAYCKQFSSSPKASGYKLSTYEGTRKRKP